MSECLFDPCQDHGVCVLELIYHNCFSPPGGTNITTLNQRYNRPQNYMIVITIGLFF